MDVSMPLQPSGLYQVSLEYQPDDPQLVLDYIHKCCCVISEIVVLEKKKSRLIQNREVIAQYKRTHPCERCGVRSPYPNDFHFFEMHLKDHQRISAKLRSVTAEYLKRVLKTRAMYCRECYPLILREVTHNIKAPPVESGSTFH